MSLIRTFSKFSKQLNTTSLVSKGKTSKVAKYYTFAETKKTNEKKKNQNSTSTSSSSSSSSSSSQGSNPSKSQQQGSQGSSQPQDHNVSDRNKADVSSDSFQSFENRLEELQKELEKALPGKELPKASFSEVNQAILQNKTLREKI